MIKDGIKSSGSDFVKLHGVEIDNTFAEAFELWYSSFLITAINKKWAFEAAREATGFGTSMIGCSSEAGIEGFYSPVETPDGRPGVGVIIFAVRKKLETDLINRIGQCVLTSPTARVFAMGEGRESIDTGYKMKFFGDGYGEVRESYGREIIAVPIMMGEFEIERNLPVSKGVAGGNLIILAQTQASALLAAEAAVETIDSVEGVITPFPGGIVGSGSKVGSKKYSFMHATTNEKFCPTLKDKVEGSALSSEIGAVSEVVIDGISEDSVRRAMKTGIETAVKIQGVKKITAGNYGGTFGKVHIYLRDLFK
ncbi:formyltransferase/hydrolase complex subunit D [archaeon]|nr:formyltransferase/hydrolase complex subunit D [archaeon]